MNPSAVLTFSNCLRNVSVSNIFRSIITAEKYALTIIGNFFDIERWNVCCKHPVHWCCEIYCWWGSRVLWFPPVRGFGSGRVLNGLHHTYRGLSRMKAQMQWKGFYMYWLYYIKIQTLLTYSFLGKSFGLSIAFICVTSFCYDWTTECVFVECSRKQCIYTREYL